MTTPAMIWTVALVRGVSCSALPNRPRAAPRMTWETSLPARKPPTGSMSSTPPSADQRGVDVVGAGGCRRGVGPGLPLFLAGLFVRVGVGGVLPARAGTGWSARRATSPARRPPWTAAQDAPPARRPVRRTAHRLMSWAERAGRCAGGATAGGLTLAKTSGGAVPAAAGTGWLTGCAGGPKAVASSTVRDRAAARAGPDRVCRGARRGALRPAGEVAEVARRGCGLRDADLPHRTPA